jgi:hypothetical protein
VEDCVISRDVTDLIFSQFPSMDGEFNSKLVLIYSNLFSDFRFWTSELQKLAPTTDRRQNDWSENGGIGTPQPDNRELQQGGAGNF